ncbi:siderophore biosynthesis protein-like protein [Methylocella silvestris BL2]|uniref:Siderophore biosynthesis protein-like protein n=1 Tax=Methylocella silvestris (strain DSM 15510 / CIP 108128 / LMG 27833 / NCIMB 13906 / BL2) TaxID=395965 RepID=B8EK53_METSB|nr:ribbon-helix-helix domain-containing protein [Methylocella silvestris]ACK50593.1 siderophore biosynthesis protein-like protein [Methylocella silvestris BL2]
MCKIFHELDPSSYQCQTRSVRLGGHVTSIRLEALFWQVLEKLAASEGSTLGRLLTKLHDESLEFQGGIGNFTALLRCACIGYAAEVGTRAGFPSLLEVSSHNYADLRGDLGKSAFLD